MKVVNLLDGLLDNYLWVLDIGSEYLNALLFNKEMEIIHRISAPSSGIKNGIITDLQSLSNSIAQLIYPVEVDTGISIKLVAISMDFSDFNIETFSISKQVDGFVTQEIIEKMKKHKKEFNFIEIDESFVLDSVNSVKNPLGMWCNGITYEAKHIYLNQFNVTNIHIIFKKFNIKIININFGIIAATNMIFEKNFILVDIGFDSTRVLKKIDEKTHLKVFYTGMNQLQNILHKGIKHSKDDSVVLSILNPKQSSTIKDYFYFLFKNFLQETQLPLFLIGGANNITLLPEFLREKFDLPVYLVEISNDDNFFISNLGIANGLLKKN